MPDKITSIEEVKKALDATSNFKVNPSDLDRCIDHVINLIDDAVLLYKNGSYSTATFLAVTIIEEVAKIHIGLFTKTPTDGKVKKSKDPLHNHKTKQIIGSNYTICMGSRLQEAIGQQRMEEIFDIAYGGNMSQYRESALYCDYKDGTICIPSEVIDQEFSKCFLLFAIESFDDNLVGWDEYSIERSTHTDRLFADIAGSECNESKGENE